MRWRLQKCDLAVKKCDMPPLPCSPARLLAAFQFSVFTACPLLCALPVLHITLTPSAHLPTPTSLPSSHKISLSLITCEMSLSQGDDLIELVCLVVRNALVGTEGETELGQVDELWEWVRCGGAAGAREPPFCHTSQIGFRGFLSTQLSDCFVRMRLWCIWQGQCIA